MDELKIGTIIETPEATLTVTNIRVIEFVGEWLTWLTVDRLVRDTGETQTGHEVELNGLINSLRKHGLAK